MSAPYILLVEDNPDDEALTRRALKKNNVASELRVVRDGAEALDFLFCRGSYADRDPDDHPRVILLDLKLPKIDGLEVLKAIRRDEQLAVLPVVILTTSNEDKDIFTGYRLGANSYIRKPVDFEQFIESLHQLGMYWLSLNVHPYVRS